MGAERTPDELKAIGDKLDAAIRNEDRRIAELDDKVDWSGLFSFGRAALNVAARIGLAYLASLSQEQIEAWGKSLAGRR